MKDDPIIRCIEQTGYAPWNQLAPEDEEDEEDEDESYEEWYQRVYNYFR